MDNVCLTQDFREGPEHRWHLNKLVDFSPESCSSCFQLRHDLNVRSRKWQSIPRRSIFTKRCSYLNFAKKLGPDVNLTCIGSIGIKTVIAFVMQDMAYNNE